MLKEILNNKNKKLNNINNDDKNNQYFDKVIKIRRIKSARTFKNKHKMNLYTNKNSNPPPKGNKIKKLDQYIKEMKLENILERNNDKDNFSDYNNKNNKKIFKESKKLGRKNKEFRTRKRERTSLIKEGCTHETLSSKDNLIKFNSNINISFDNEKVYEQNQRDNSFKNEKEGHFEIYNYNEKNRERKSTKINESIINKEIDNK
jgi:hypothetical protein